ncbi:MAG: hypothetical protein E5V90_15500, partial [Mesorhizobium sp.]
MKFARSPLRVIVQADLYPRLWLQVVETCTPKRGGLTASFFCSLYVLLIPLTKDAANAAMPHKWPWERAMAATNNAAAATILHADLDAFYASVEQLL